MSTNLLQSLQILTKFIIETVGKELRVLAIHNILLSIEEPFGDFVLSRVLQDRDNSFKFFGRELAGTKNNVQVSTQPEINGRLRMARGLDNEWGVGTAC